MRGVSNIVLLLITIIIVISSIASLWLYFSGVLKIATSSDSRSTLGNALSSCMKIDSVKDNKIYLRNCGSGVVTNSSLKVYLDGILINFSMSPQVLNNSVQGIISLYGLWDMNLSLGENYELKITSPTTQVKRYVKAVVPDSAVLDLEFDEGSGDVAYDSSEQGNNGNLINNPVWVDGKFGKALQFDGTNNKYVSLPNTITRFGSGNYTFTLWFYQFPNSGTRELFAQRELVADSVVNLTDSYHYQNGVLYFNVYSIGSTNHQTVHSSISVLDGIWHFVAMGRNGSAMFMYVDGVNVTQGSDININTVPNFTVPFYIGKSSGYHADGMNGTIDSMRIYNIALTPDETVSLMLGELT